MTSECCPLCKSNVGKLRVMFVNFVTSTEENVRKYFAKELTFESWKADLKKAMGEDNNVQ